MHNCYYKDKSEITYMFIEKKNMLFTKEASGWFKGFATIMVILSHYAEWWSWFFEEEGIREFVRYGISRMGPYGVAVFLLFSGYGLAKSAGDKRIGIKFILKRVIGVYIPYLVMVLVMEALSGELQSWDDLSDIWYGQNFWYMTVLFSFYLGFMAIWLLWGNRHIRAVLIVIFTYVYSNHLYNAGEYDFWYISNIAFAIGVLLALYESEIQKINQKIWISLSIILGMGSFYVAYSALYVERVWVTPVDEIRHRILAVTVFSLFITFAASIWSIYDPVGRFIGKYSLYFYLSHTFLFMWTINHFEYEMAVRFVIAAIVILAVSVLMGSVISKLMDILYQKAQVIVDFKKKKG